VNLSLTKQGLKVARRIDIDRRWLKIDGPNRIRPGLQDLSRARIALEF
jgi:hypothetical protein